MEGGEADAVCVGEDDEVKALNSATLDTYALEFLTLSTSYGPPPPSPFSV
jgi:hypothetical protein